jgi:restriction system protein
MTGKEFEIFLQHLLTARGFNVKGVYHGNDGGVDLVAKKNKEIYSIQAKKRKNTKKRIDRSAISDAVSGIKFRDCTRAMTITNSYFTKVAKEYARKTECVLIDRDILAEWIYELDS